MKKRRLKPSQVTSQFVELLSVSGGLLPTGSLPAHLSTPEKDGEPVVLLTVRRPHSYTPFIISISESQAMRLREDLDAAFENDPFLNRS